MQNNSEWNAYPRQNPNPDNFPQQVWFAGGIIYFNRTDPRVFVPKRSGLGITVNFARPLSLFWSGVPFLILLVATVPLASIILSIHQSLLMISPLLVLLVLNFVFLLLHLKSLLMNRAM